MSREEKIAELLNSENFISKLDSIHSYEELAEEFGNNGVDISADEVEALSKDLVVLSKTGELDLEQLDSVSGGVTVGQTAKLCWTGWKAGWSAGKKFSDWMYNTFGVN